MNMHVAQSIVTENELRSIAAVPYQIMSPKECKPLVAVVQDVALGIYRLTKKHITLSEKQLFNLLCTNTKFYGNVPKPSITNGDIKTWSGKQALSAIIPNNVNMKSANNSYDESFDDKDNFVIIENGEIIQGTIDKKIYQNRTKGLIHSIYNDCNEEETRHFFDNTQKLICNWLVQSGFSVGISDLIVDDETQLNLKKIINDMKVKVYDIIKDIHMNKFENLSINDNNDYFESEINKILNKAREQTGKLGLGKINDLENRMINMIKSGSKGSVINVAQMIACVGQQNVDGKRIAYGFENRTLPHFVKYDDGPDSRGFVENSFISGLSPQEFFFHSMGGREGLIDTAVKTSETGYIQRKLVKAMEDCKINYDYTVRNASGSIIQFLYGDDGMDPIKIESQSLPYIDMDLQKLQKEYLLTTNDDFQHLLDPEVLSSLKGNWEAPFKTHFNTILEDREFMIMQIFKGKQNNSFMYPVSFTRIINNAKAMMKRYGMSILSDLNPRYVLDTINKLSDELYISKNNKGNRFINILINAYLSPKQVMYQYKFNKDVFDYVVQQVKHRFFDAIAHPSEMVGVVAAQSIGEPCTQMSATKDTVVRITGPNEYSYVGPIGTFVDDLMNKNKEKCIEFMKDHYVLDLDTDYNVIGVSNEEKTSWKKISQISRHPANGGLVKVTTRSGRTTTATLTHSFLGRTTNGIKEVKGSDLKVGDRVPVAKYIQEVNTPKTTFEIQGIGQVQLTKDFGWFCGIYLADGHINNNTIQITKCIKEYNAKLHDIINNMFGIQVYTKEGTKSCFNKYPSKSYPFIENKFNSKPLAQFLSNNFGEGSANKYIPSWVYGSNTDFISGILQGYFDGDGNVNGTPKKSMIRVGSISKQLIQDVSVLLSYFGIFGSLCIEESRTGATNKPFYTIQISRKYANDFKDKIGFIVETKKMELEKMLEYVNRDDKHSDQEVIDKIPELGHIIAQIGKDLKLPGQSRLYGRWAKKESIGRFTLIKYIKVFEEENMSKNLGSVSKNIEILKQAAYSDVIWDEIVYLEYLDDPQEYVYDFTVPGNDSFMVDCGVLVHNTLNTFHHSGISSASKAVRGVPRIKELLSVTKNIKAPSMTIHLKEDYKKDKMKANTVVKSIQTTFFKDIVKTSKIYYDAQDFKTDIDDDALFVNSYKELMDKELIQDHDTAPWLLRIELNRDKLLEEGISMLTLYNILQDYYEDTISCMFSDDNSSNLIFRIKFIDDNSSDDDRDYITELKALEKNIMDNILIKGVKNVNKAMMNKQEYQIYDPETLQFRKTFEWVLDTSGTNMIDVMCHPHIDYTKTVSNDINEIYDILGIEAARNALYNELSGVISDAELYVNYRHIALLVDTMTNRGYLLSIDRHGINRVDIGPLAKCSFEETTDMLIKAGIFSEVDKITGVSANIMLGQIPPCGTGDSEILIDEHKLLNNIKTTFDDTDKTDYEDVCSFDNLSFDFRLPNKNEDIDTIKDFDIKVV